jgi:hypothetical protein
VLPPVQLQLELVSQNSPFLALLRRLPAVLSHELAQDVQDVVGRRKAL